MAILPILVAPDPRLKTRAKPVETIDDDLRRLIDDMLETMYDAPGIGLAAPQVGVLKRLLVLDVAGKDDPPAPMAFVNPEIVWESEEMNVYEEGCLSIPSHYAEVERPARVKVRFLDRDGNRREIEADGLLATCVQHEIDHLDGKLFIDYLSSLKRNMILRKLKKETTRESA
ncbi:peptide deformylase [uncultured Alphaproteobacteria bacterium]|uniref:Peptide deformylase n=1 Tax=uncultured Alphaproteobacteria bacterium TaxID=91750 RepID=A0A212KKQ5_9PROT|nr:peptide deformylase [uncultured Alphaproteobacteria bacterium]